MKLLFRKVSRPVQIGVSSLGILSLLGGLVYLSCVMWSSPFRIYGRYDEYASGGAFKGSAFSVSPNGSTIVYASPRTGQGDLYSVSLDGSNPQQRTHDPNYEGNPCYSPDGKQIVFEREEGKCGHIWIMNADGSGQKQLTFGSTYDAEPCFAPDGKHLWYTRMPQGTNSSSMYAMDIDGHNQAPITCEGESVGYEATFPKSRNVIYYSRGSDEIWKMLPNWTGKHFVGKGWSPSISPDGSKIAFLYEPYSQSLWVMNADGSDRKLVYNTPSYKSHVRFHPDGKHILFVDEGVGANDRPGTIYSIRIDGSGLKSVTSMH
jgi:Tol biopolymer transport system component